MKDPELRSEDEPVDEVRIVAGRFQVLLYWMAYDTNFADELYGMLVTDPRRN